MPCLIMKANLAPGVTKFLNAKLAILQNANAAL